MKQLRADKARHLMSGVVAAPCSKVHVKASLSITIETVTSPPKHGVTPVGIRIAQVNGRSVKGLLVEDCGGAMYYGGLDSE